MNLLSNDDTRPFPVLSAGVMIGHYQIIERIGAGGMGEVFLAEDTQLKRRVALKFLPPQFLAEEDYKTRFRREAQAAAALNHPNIVTIHEVAEHMGRPYIAMEHVTGQSLRQKIQTAPLAIEDILDLGIQIGEGLAKAHQHGIIHRDIKSMNILVDADGRARILDFGLAAVQGSEQLTRAGSTLGTVAYMSPEQVLGKPTDHRSDIFSFGVVLFEMITGRLPFTRDNDIATAQAIANDPAPPLQNLRASATPGLQAIIDKALDKDNKTRYQTANDMVADLRREKRLLDSGARTASYSGSALATAKKKPAWRAIALSGTALVIVVAALLVLKPWQFELKSSNDAVAGENRLAIMYFDNLADPDDSQRMGQIVTDLLITDLSEAQNLNVVSSQRLYDLLKQLGKEGVRSVDKETASRVAEKARAKWMLTGKILQSTPKVVLTAQVIDVQSGEVKASKRMASNDGEDIFSLVDRLTLELSNDLSAPVSSGPSSHALAGATTHSQDAYRLFLEGVELMMEFKMDQARERFVEALKYDSTMAMAYYLLSNGSSNEQAQEYLAKAVKFADRASQKERWYIASRQAAFNGRSDSAVYFLNQIIQRYPDDKEAHYFLATGYSDQGRFPEAIAELEKVLALDPTYKVAVNQLGYMYMRTQEFAKAEDIFNRYIAIVPDEPNPYDSRADLYAWTGRFTEAIASYSRTLKVDSSFFQSRMKLFSLYVWVGNYDSAATLIPRLLQGRNAEEVALGRSGSAAIKLAQGQFRGAYDDISSEFAAVFRNGKPAEQLVGYQRLFGIAYYAGWTDTMKAVLLRMEPILAAIPENIFRGRDTWARYYALVGDKQKADSLLTSLETDLLAKFKSLPDDYLTTRAVLDTWLGRPERSVAPLERMMTKIPLPFGSAVRLCQAYVALKQYDKAIVLLEKAMQVCNSDWLFSATLHAEGYYMLGQAYEATQQNQKAAEAYTRFLDIYKNADPGQPKVADARARLAKLKA